MPNINSINRFVSGQIDSSRPKISDKKSQAYASAMKLFSCIPLPQKQLSFVNRQISIESSRKNLPECMRLLNVAKQCFHPDADSYNPVISLCMKQQKYDEAIDLVTDMEEQRVRPNLETCALALQYFDHIHDAIGALELYKMMRQQEISPDRNFYSVLIQLFVETKGYAIPATHLMIEMKNKGLYPNEKAYISVINFCAKNRWYPLVFSYIKEMKQQGMTIDEASYTSLLKVVASQGDLHIMQELRKGRL